MSADEAGFSTDDPTADSRPAASAWPALPLAPWEATHDTLHMWSQIVGKIRLMRAPLLNHWWDVPFHLTSRGWTTTPIPHGTRTFDIDFHFVDHRLEIRTSEGGMSELPLRPRAVAAFPTCRIGPPARLIPTRSGAGGGWPGKGLGQPAFCAYAYPTPSGFADADPGVDGARFDADLGEFVLPWDAVRTSDDPDATVLGFMQATYEATADLGGWDRAALERSPADHERLARRVALDAD